MREIGVGNAGRCYDSRGMTAKCGSYCNTFVLIYFFKWNTVLTLTLSGWFRSLPTRHWWHTVSHSRINVICHFGKHVICDLCLFSSFEYYSHASAYEKARTTWILPILISRNHRPQRKIKINPMEKRCARCEWIVTVDKTGIICRILRCNLHTYIVCGTMYPTAWSGLCRCMDGTQRCMQMPPGMEERIENIRDECVGLAKITNGKKIFKCTNENGMRRRNATLDMHILIELLKWYYHRRDDVMTWWRVNVVNRRRSIA